MRDLWLPRRKLILPRGLRRQRGNVNIIPVMSRVGDVFFPQVGLLLHMNGTNGSTTFTDSSANNFTGTAVGNAQLSTTGPKYGSACGLFDGSGDWVTFADNAALQMGAGDFTIEFWIKHASLAGANPAVVKGAFAGAGTYVIRTNSTTGLMTYVVASTQVMLEAGTVATGTWYHYAIVRSGSAMTMYRDGVSVATATNSANLNDTGIQYIGGDQIGSSHNGNIDDVRITKGVARYTATFTPPAAAFPDPY